MLSSFTASAASVLWSCNFSNANWFAEWNNGAVPSGKRGISFNSSTNITRIDDPAAPGGSFLRIHYPAGSYAPSGGPPIGGTQFYGAVLRASGNTPMDAATLQFSVRFPAGFNFVLGGKLPGFYGGVGNTGTNYPTGTDGFTTRFMWRQNGAGEAYPFLPNSPTIYGTSLGRGNWSFVGDGQWHTIRQEVALNDVGAQNGLIRVWYDDELVLEAPGLFFRTSEELKIDGVLFQTFFGGGDPAYATPVDTHADFANFVVSEFPEHGSPTLLSNYQTRVLSQAPAHYFRFDGSFTDALNQSATFLQNGNPGFAPDYFRNGSRAVFFSASNDALLSTEDLIPGGGQPSAAAQGKGTVSLLFRTLDSTNNAAQRFVFSQGNATANGNAFGLFFENSSNSDANSLKLRAGDRTTVVLRPGEILPATWYYFAVTFDEARNAEELRCFIGVLGSTELRTGSINIGDSAVVGDNGALYVGNNSGLNNSFRNPGNGRIDELAIWYHELTASEILAQFESVLVRPEPPPPLSIELSGGEVILSWPASAGAGWILEHASTLSPDASWLFAGDAVLDGERFRVTKPVHTGPRFYRLGSGLAD